MSIVMIQSGSVAAEISTLGAELQSLTVSGKNLLWSGDPAFWTGRSPILFPIVGGLVNDTYTLGGQSYSMKKHGFARKSEFSVTAQTQDSVTLTLLSDPSTLAQYPFEHTLSVTFQVREGGLDVNYEVENRDAKTMYFSLGAHEAYACPVNDLVRFSDYYIELEKKENLGRYYLYLDKPVLKDEIVPFLEDDNIIELNWETFEKDAIVLEGLQSRKAWLKCRRSDLCVEVSFPGHTHLGIWTKPGAPYVCIEPWFGMNDLDTHNGRIEEKRGMVKLEAGKTFRCGHAIRAEKGKPLMTAHAGCDGTKDDTVDSFLAGMRSGADVVEVDLRFRDGKVPVLSHNSLSEREGTPIDTFEEVLKAVQGNKHLRINMDMKEKDGILNLVPLLERYGMKDRVFFSGIHKQFLSHPEVQASGIPYLWNIELMDIGTGSRKTLAALVEHLHKSGAFGFNINYHLLTRKMFDFFTENGVPVYVWTVNEAEDVRRLAEWGVRSITTRNTPVVRQVLSR